jgi:hypothetical protein
MDLFRVFRTLKTTRIEIRANLYGHTRERLFVWNLDKIAGNFDGALLFSREDYESNDCSRKNQEAENPAEALDPVVIAGTGADLEKINE